MDLTGDAKKLYFLLAIVLFFSILFSVSIIAEDNVSTTENADQTIGDENTNDLDQGDANNIDENLNNSESGEDGELNEDTSEDNVDGGLDEVVIEDETENELAEDEFIDAELQASAGITPDSNFYFVEDSILSKFRDELENKEKKIAEIIVMVNEGNIEDARKALERYNRYASELEEEADPEKRDEARRSAAAIRNTLREIENEIPEDNRQEFVDDVIDREGKIVTAVEIAGKIRDLCEQLSGLDPLEYNRVCRVDGNGPNWQKKLDKKLTKEQGAEAKVFGEIMSQCFQTNGRECRCEYISIKPFANRCSIVAPLAVACDNGDESACEAMDDATDGLEDLLPDYLQDIMLDVERNFGEDQFKLHMPRECSEVGAKTQEQCMEIMFKLNAPEECIEAFENGEIDFSNEKQARESCERIMFEANAPEECIDRGLKNPKECGKLMFQLNAPEECISAGLTGDSRSDEKKCREIMDNSREDENKGRDDFRGGNCKAIENQQERLDCYDGYAGGIQEHYEQRESSGGWPEPCQKAEAFSRESCENIMKQWGNQQKQDFDKRYGETKDRERQCAESCSSQGGAWSFINGECDCRVENREYRDEFRREQRPPEEFVPHEEFNPEQSREQPQSEEEKIPPTTPESTTPTTTQASEGQTTVEHSSEGTSESTSTSENSGSPVTGSVISSNDRFSYYFWN